MLATNHDDQLGEIYPTALIPGPETHHTTTGIAPLVDHGLHG